MVAQYTNLINGEMFDNGQWIDVVNPANEKVIGQVPACGSAELDTAVAAARAAFKTWSRTPIKDRRAAIQRISAIIEENSDELIRLLTSEQGKPHAEATQEIIGASMMAAAQSTFDLDDEVAEDSEQRRLLRCVWRN